MNTRSLLPLAIAALVVSGCGGGSDGYSESQSPVVVTPPPAPPPVQPTGESFTDWSRNGVFAKAPDGEPEVMDDLAFNFDGDDNPNAYSDLLPPES